MFATIHTVSQPKNFAKKLKYNLLPPPVKVEVVNVEEGSDFLKLTVPVIRGKIHWNAVRSATGNTALTLLAPRDVSLQEQVHLKAFHMQTFASVLCINSFIRALKLMPHTSLLTECAVIDYSGSLAPLCHPLPQFCRTIKIITANAEKYEAFCRLCLYEYGTAVYLSDDIGKAFYSPTVLHAKPARVPVAFSAESTVFAADAARIYAPKLITPEGVVLPEKYVKMLPAGIPPVTFAAALYEVSGVSALAQAYSPAFRQNNRILSYKDITSILD